MSLFKSRDTDHVIQPMTVQGKASAAGLQVLQRFTAGETTALIERTIGSLIPGQSIFFKTDGAWSNVELLEFILAESGPADVYFTTWSISAEAIARFSAWQQQGQIKQMFAVLDTGLRNRKPEIYQQSTAAFTNLKIAHCHAKVTVIRNETHSITLIGSANYTKNPRLEAGMIIWDNQLADENIKWILEVVYGV